MSALLKVLNLHAGIGDKQILKGVNLTIKIGEVHVVMGPNGSGKSTLANVLMGNPKFKVTDGAAEFDGKNILELKPEERAALGIFMAFQYPREIAGIAMNQMLHTAYSNLYRAYGSQATSDGSRTINQRSLVSIMEFNEKIKREAKNLKLNPELTERSINEGFSGGEKKKAEMLQLAILEPKLAILDETDSGLDVDALKIVGESISCFRNDTRSILIVTHYQRILQYLHPNFIHVMIGGKIVKSGNMNLAKELDKDGYKKFTNRNS